MVSKFEARYYWVRKSGLWEVTHSCTEWYFFIYQIANLCDQKNELIWPPNCSMLLLITYQIDPVLLSSPGQIFSKQDDYYQGLHHQLGKFQNGSVDLDVISWLDIWFSNNEMYKNSIHLFNACSENPPKWSQMLTYCSQLLSKCGRFYKSSKTLQRNPWRKP